MECLTRYECVDVVVWGKEEEEEEERNVQRETEKRSNQCQWAQWSRLSISEADSQSLEYSQMATDR